MVAVLDACVLYSAPLRDLLLHTAIGGVFQARWTERIHDEWRDSLLEKRPEIPREKLHRVRQLMNAHSNDSVVSGYEYLIDQISLPDQNDRHVLAAAIHTEASTIVTYNLSDFPSTFLKPYNITAVHPDIFIISLLEANPRGVMRSVTEQRAKLRAPTVSMDELLLIFEKQQLPKTVKKIRNIIKTM